MNAMTALANLRHFLEPWDRYGFDQRHDALIWGSSTETTNRGWLHQVMLPHASEELDRFHAENRFLEAFRHPRLWCEMNGFNLFSKAFSLFGPALHSEPPRVWRAYNVVTTNMGQGGFHQRFDGIIFGGAEHGRRSVWLLETRSGEVVSADRETSQEIFRWPDFDSFLPAALNELAANWSEDERRVTHLSFVTGGA
ncbi:hypothetical protein FHG66_20780 [Rubellimicrobium rubrum]|uniref:SMI1/KNR4 family protein n=1 Tax=Rubellimicrobium rubrum TaxID=2585369 RepID=A0A5C4ML77_9RHOB|nr:hypothetical protein [Rubellimicrobium rubrum]TNC43791.1 hypothetical protein FHG66_20780 [Rubellimicrobium rubrum]